MKRFICGFTFLMSCTAMHSSASSPGQAYMNCIDAVLLVGKHKHGSKEWQDKNDEWLNNDKEEPYPDDLREIDGHGYNDGKNAAEDCWS